VIDTDEKLAAFLPQLNAATWIALDTEADSLHAYPEKLCLIQVSIEGYDELIDPLAVIQLQPLFEILTQHELIMHGADYDLRLLRKHCGFVPTAIFDTMLASRLRHRSGLVNWSRNTSVKLERKARKANWARRPLTERMASYARHDTHYLKPLADILRELKAKGRWLAPAVARSSSLTAPCCARPTRTPSGASRAAITFRRRRWRCCAKSGTGARGGHHVEPPALFHPAARCDGAGRGGRRFRAQLGRESSALLDAAPSQRGVESHGERPRRKASARPASAKGSSPE
jgi:hypothetical protein